MEVLTAEQMRRADAHAIERLGVPGLVLMEAAGEGVARALRDDWPDLAARGVLVLAGKGNNGGDGLVAARHLAACGIRARVLLFARARDLVGDPAVQYGAARGAGVEVIEITTSEDWHRHVGGLRPPTVVLDALLGTGARGGARGLVGEAIEDLNASGVEVAAVDLPSGLDADRPRAPDCTVRARRTYTLCRPKLPLAAGQADEVCGRWRVVPIGIPAEAISKVESRLAWFDEDDARALLGPRRADAHKGTFGHLLAVAGSLGKSGAASLVADGALRTGVGLVTVAAPEAARAEVAVRRAEVMTERLPETVDGSLAEAADETVRTLAAARDAIALGPGLGTADETVSAVVGILTGADRPAVVDADALNALATRGRETIARAGRAGPRVLTPHPGEAARLLGTSTPEIQADRPAAATELARHSGSVVVLKGHRSAIAHPDGRLSFNASGNPGMATAGSGDVLTGVVGALLARGMDPFDAARLGVWLHGRAGDLAEREIGPAGFLAGEIAAYLPRAIRSAVARPDR